jgi:ribose transport system ATP-binding protein
VLLRIDGLRKRFGPTVALDGVSIELQPGQVHALVGENGAGKSTLMNVLAGSVRPDAGAMLLDGRPYRPASPLDASRAGVALIHQELSLCPHLTVAENGSRIRSFGPTASSAICRLPRARWSRSAGPWRRVRASC